MSRERIQELVELLNNHTRLYDEGNPAISDSEWDDLYFELTQLEKETGIILPNSPTQNISFEVKSKLDKAQHDYPMLSLKKTKSLDEVKSFLGHEPYLAMAKLDGLSCSLKYRGGRLIGASTRGDGEVGEDVLHNALVVKSIPNSIPYMKDLTVHGEILCTFANFKEFEGQYKNPRNFASGSIRLLDSGECAKRNLTFVAWEVLEGLDNLDNLSDRLLELVQMGFTAVPFSISGRDLNDVVHTVKVLSFAFPTDGIVFKFNSKKYGNSLGKTGHHFKNALAYKFTDELYETYLEDIHWSMSRNGTLTPVAIFNPIDIDGSTIAKASLHNLDIMEDVLGKPYRNQKIYVYKANQIIPQIAKAEKNFQDKEPIGLAPSHCPYCQSDSISIQLVENTNLVKCVNPSCSGKLINRIDHYCSKSGMDIKGLSKATLEKFINEGFINSVKDIYYLYEYRDKMVKLPKFGVKSVSNILNAIEESKECKLENFISAIGIPGVGLNTAKLLVSHLPTWDSFLDAVENSSNRVLNNIPTIGVIMQQQLKGFNYDEAKELVRFLTFVKEEPAKEQEQTLSNKNIAITGKLKLYKNRDALKAEIESRGGKVTGSVSGKTDYLINNDSLSESSKNVTAKRLGVPILTESEFKDQFLNS